MCFPLKCSYLHYVNRSFLNMLWTIHSSGNSIWNTPWPMSFEILNSSYLLWSNFFKGCFKWIFLASSHMLSPTFSSCGFLLFLLNYFFITSFAISIDIFALSQLLCIPLRKSSSFSNSVLIVRFPFYRYLPKLSSNRVCSIVAYFLLLYWNFTTNNQSIQLSC